MTFKRQPEKERVITAVHAPGSIIDYTLDFTNIFSQTSPVDTVSSVAAVSSGGVVVAGTSNTASTATVRISGGTALGSISWVTVTVTGASGQDHIWVLRIQVGHMLVQPNTAEEFTFD